MKEKSTFWTWISKDQKETKNKFKKFLKKSKNKLKTVSDYWFLLKIVNELNKFI